MNKKSTRRFRYGAKRENYLKFNYRISKLLKKARNKNLKYIKWKTINLKSKNIFVQRVINDHNTLAFRKPKLEINVFLKTSKFLKQNPKKFKYNVKLVYINLKIFLYGYQHQQQQEPAITSFINDYNKFLNEKIISFSYYFFYQIKIFKVSTGVVGVWRVLELTPEILAWFREHYPVPGEDNSPYTNCFTFDDDVLYYNLEYEEEYETTDMEFLIERNDTMYNMNMIFNDYYDWKNLKTNLKYHYYFDHIDKISSTYREVLSIIEAFRIFDIFKPHLNIQFNVHEFRAKKPHITTQHIYESNFFQNLINELKIIQTEFKKIPQIHNRDDTLTIINPLNDQIQLLSFTTKTHKIEFLLKSLVTDIYKTRVQNFNIINLLIDIYNILLFKFFDAKDLLFYWLKIIWSLTKIFYRNITYFIYPYKKAVWAYIWDIDPVHFVVQFKFDYLMHLQLLNDNYHKLRIITKMNKYRWRLTNHHSRLNEVNIAFHPDSIFALYIDVFPVSVYFSYISIGVLFSYIYMKYYHTTIANKLKRERLIRKYFFGKKKYHKIKSYLKLSEKLQKKELDEHSVIQQINTVLEKPSLKIDETLNKSIEFLAEVSKDSKKTFSNKLIK